MSREPIREMRLDVKPGLYALRYVSSVDVRTAPSASVSPVATSVGDVEIVSVPGASPGDLGAPGTSVVIVASAAGAVLIRLTAFAGSQNLDARFSLDLLAAAEGARPLAPGRPPEAEAAALPGEARLDVVAHVSRRGDVRVDTDGWIAGPRAPSSIEALRIEVRGADLGVAAQFRNVESRAAWSPWSTPGGLIGVPKRACPLTGIRLKLVGPAADRYDLVGEGLFLGAPQISAKGGEIEFVAAGELDPLIGLKLTLAERPAASPPLVAEKPSRVRVFR